MDITNFINWFINQVIQMLTTIYSILDSITFNGLSLLKLSIAILIIGTFIPIIFTLNKDVERVGGKIARSNKEKKKD